MLILLVQYHILRNTGLDLKNNEIPTEQYLAS